MMSDHPQTVFALNEQLLRDTIYLGHYPLCEVRMMDEKNYPWFILVPMRMSESQPITEICYLNHKDQQQLVIESSDLAKAMLQLFKPDKLNIATIGNRVPQLHVHHIARFAHDPCWPDTVWGRHKAVRYDPVAIQTRTENLIDLLSAGFSV